MKAKELKEKARLRNCLQLHDQTLSATMDKKYYHLHPSTPILNMFWIMAGIGTVGEYQFLGDELSTRNVWIVD
jgi:hypothetical protein